MKASGTLFLTNFRVVLVNRSDWDTNDCKEFEFKSYKVYDEEFDADDEGSDVFKGMIQTYDEAFPADLGFKLTLEGNPYSDSTL